MEDYERLGWQAFGYEAGVARWAEAALEEARTAVASPEMAIWHQCEGTWFVGVDALGNDAAGALNGLALEGAALAAAQGLFGTLPLHKGQVSVIYEGYPRPRAGEGEAAFRYRLKRDAAHLDGLKSAGPEKRRKMDEFHGFILGFPLTDERAAPLVVWEGSHVILQQMLVRCLGDVPPARWHEVDLTEPYQAARREVFETCPRVEVQASPGEAYLLHRFALHGVAPWRGAATGADGRAVVYFRPEVCDRLAWLQR